MFNTGLFRLSSSVTTRSILVGSRFKLLSANMASVDSASQKVADNKGFVLHSIRSLNQGESKYVRPMRMHFTLNGRTRAWDCLKVHDSVACVIYNKSRNKLIYVKQFRPAVYMSSLTASATDMSEVDVTHLPTTSDKKVGYTMELCAGLADKEGKTPQQVMQEEISEETGYNVPLESIKFIGSFRGSTGLSGTLQSMYFVEVTDDQKSAQGGGVDDEAIEVLEFDPEDVRKTLYCRDEDAPYSRPPAMLFGTSWFLNEYLNKSNK